MAAFRVELKLTTGWMENFNLSRLKAKTNVVMTAVTDRQYADNCTILAHTPEELQTCLDLLTEAYQSVCLSINIKKTKIIYQTTQGNIERPDINISGTTLEVI